MEFNKDTDFHSDSGHTGGHSHSHAHTHSHGPASGRAFLIGVLLNSGFVVVEIVYGLLAHSMSLLADAGHNISDVAGLLLAWGATVLARRIPTRRHTYGMGGTTILAALLNAALVFVGLGGIAWESIRRLNESGPVQTGTMLWVACVGIAVNLGSALMFMRGTRHDLNIRGAMMHMISDAAVSFGVVVAALAIRFTGEVWIDPAICLVLVAVIGYGTWDLLRDSANMVINAVPKGIDAKAVEQYLCSLPGVLEIHDLHIWAMSTTSVALTAHLVKPSADGDDELLTTLCKYLNDRFGIDHSTIQWERAIDTRCALAPADVV